MFVTGPTGDDNAHTQQLRRFFLSPLASKAAGRQRPPAAARHHVPGLSAVLSLYRDDAGRRVFAGGSREI